MANRTSSKRKSKTKVGSSSKAKDAKTKKKRGRKVAPPILRPTLPMTPTGQNRGLKIYCTDINGKSTSMKRKSKKEVGESSKAKDAKTQKKRGRKVSPPISRPTLPM
ncbi:hypothetical protein AABB24_013451 [Solanum stoloniferum]|uniref:Uncharacterized protein n=1 Tax=Solanum stoloniferum TaxID=62892 RepID=A0ABD2QT84_9SOLN